VLIRIHAALLMQQWNVRLSLVRLNHYEVRWQIAHSSSTDTITSLMILLNKMSSGYS